MKGKVQRRLLGGWADLGRAHCEQQASAGTVMVTSDGEAGAVETAGAMKSA